MKDLVIWGAGGHAKVVADIIALGGIYRTVAFLDDTDPRRAGETFCGVEVYVDRACLDVFLKRGVRHLLVAVGDNRARCRLADMAERKGFNLVGAIHPSAVVAGDVTLGPGVVMTAGSVANPGASLGRCVIVNTGATVGHDCRVEEGAHIAPGSNIAGLTTIGARTFVAIGARIGPKRTIGADTVIGAGAVVVRDIPPGVKAWGVPARVICGNPDSKAEAQKAEGQTC